MSISGGNGTYTSMNRYKGGGVCAYYPSMKNGRMRQRQQRLILNKKLYGGEVLSYICEVCGSEYEPNEVWRSKLTCCPDCYSQRQKIMQAKRRKRATDAKTYTCKICGKEYHVDKIWRSKITCSKGCNAKRRSEISKDYWSKVKDGIIEARRQGDKPAFIIRYEHKDYSKNTLAQINDIARDNNMTYGQMQAYLWTQKHPVIDRRRA